MRKPLDLDFGLSKGMVWMIEKVLMNICSSQTSYTSKTIVCLFFRTSEFLIIRYRVYLCFKGKSSYIFIVFGQWLGQNMSVMFAKTGGQADYQNAI